MTTRDPRSLRIIYMGTPDFAVAPLRALVENGYRVAGVVTMPDKPAGRGLKVQSSPVKRYALEAGLPVLQPERLRDPAFLERLRELAPDLGIVVAFRMLPEAVWAMPPMGTFNLHASLLPQYRGAAPINWALINGDRHTGVTTFLLNARIDEGTIIARREVEIDPEDDAGTLHDKLMNIGASLVPATVDALASGDYVAERQDHIPTDTLRPAPKIFKPDCRIDWTLPGRRIVDFVRGLSPYPTAWSELVRPDDQSTTVKVFKAFFLPQPSVEGPCGTIRSDGRSELRVACADGWVAIEELQLAGKKRLGMKELLLGLHGVEQLRFE